MQHLKPIRSPYLYLFSYTVLALALVPGIGASERIRETRTAHEIAASLARLGPRTVGSEGHADAITLLTEEMKRAGLRVLPGPLGGPAEALQNLEGVLPGAGNREIVLTAHYDTVAGSPGAGDDASGCGVVLAAATALSGTSLRHRVRVLLFDQEEDRLKGSRAWLKERTTLERERILAVLNVEMVGWRGSQSAVVHTFPVTRNSRTTLAPGWLVGTLLDTGRESGWPVSLTDPTLGVFGQLVLRSTRPGYAADSDAFLAAGIPALFVSDTSLSSFDPAYHRERDSEDRLDPDRLESWTEFLVTAVRRIDRSEAAGELSEDRYLVLFGRLWPRSTLVACGVAVCGVVLLVAIGRSRGRWTGIGGNNRRTAWILASGVLAALAAITAPVFSSILILPVLPLVLFRPRSRWGSWLLRLCAASPSLILLALVGWSLWAGWTRPVIPSKAGLPPAVALISLYFTLAARRGDQSTRKA